MWKQWSQRFLNEFQEKNESHLQFACYLDSAHFHPNCAGLAVLFSRQTLTDSWFFWNKTIHYSWKPLWPMPSHFCHSLFWLQLVLNYKICSTFVVRIFFKIWTNPLVDLYLISEKSIWKNQVLELEFSLFRTEFLLPV